MASKDDRAAITIRPMADGEVERCIAMEQAATRFGWNTRQLVDSLTAGNCGYVLLLSDTLAGYCLAGYIRAMSMPGEMQILNLVIARENQSMGLGSRLLAYLVAQARSRELAEIWLEVRASNLVAIQLYQSVGFKLTGARKNYYPAVDGREDALVMRKSLAP